MTKNDWANNLLNDEFFKEMMAELKAAELDCFANSDIENSFIREQCYLKLKVLNEIESHIKGLSMQKKIDKSRWKIL
jgi:hypothetical protein